MKEKKYLIEANGTQISVLLSPEGNNDYISLTDIARKKSKDPNDTIRNWLRLRSTIDFLGLWEALHNPDFKPVDFDGFRQESGTNAFTLSPKEWISKTNAIGIRSRSGRYGGTWAHSDIALEFASWISPEFKLYIIKDYQRLKKDENVQYSLEWDIKRSISKTNYKLQTDAIKENLIPENLDKKRQGFIYASEADMLNNILFNMTHKEWKERNPDKPGNLRDDATIEELIVFSNLENLNSILIGQGVDQFTRYETLNETAAKQLKSIQGLKSVKKIKEIE